MSGTHSFMISKFRPQPFYWYGCWWQKTFSKYNSAQCARAYDGHKYHII